MDTREQLTRVSFSNFDHSYHVCLYSFSLIKSSELLREVGAYARFQQLSHCSGAKQCGVFIQLYQRLTVLNDPEHIRGTRGTLFSTVKM